MWKIAIFVPSFYFLAAVLAGFLLNSDLGLIVFLKQMPLVIPLVLNGLSFLLFMGSFALDMLLINRIGFPYLLFWPIFLCVVTWTHLFLLEKSKASDIRSDIRLAILALVANNVGAHLPSWLKIRGFTDQARTVILIRSVLIIGPFCMGTIIISTLSGINRKKNRLIFSLSMFIGSFTFYSYLAAGYALGGAFQRL